MKQMTQEYVTQQLEQAKAAKNARNVRHWTVVLEEVKKRDAKLQKKEVKQ